jgi:hypothetical protein
MPLDGFDWVRARSATAEAPLRVLTSACLVGKNTGWEGGPYTEASKMLDLGSPNRRTPRAGSRCFDASSRTRRASDRT